MHFEWLRFSIHGPPWSSTPSIQHLTEDSHIAAVSNEPHPFPTATIWRLNPARARQPYALYKTPPTRLERLLVPFSVRRKTSQEREPMEIRIPSPVSVIRSSESVFKTRVSINPNPNLLQSSRGRRSRTQLLIRDSRFSTRIRAVDEAISTVDPVRAEITWQIVIGALGILKSFFFGPLILL